MEPDKTAAVKVAALGFGLEVVGWATAAFFPIEAIRRGAPLMISAGVVAMVYGCVLLAKAKGHTWHVGLLGLMSFVGLAILWFLIPDKRPAGR